ncbi:hypothetical protein D0864_13563 [Hortaea werneckii]|uniref:Prokaryotic-type class I peptide chain release factors domain-containing protein n=1 Tax=Hortaea werneckii TaxID=91943 RepID=A0A3M7DN82_HORWE|nr:hypothetical protein D0864_13563 [Hortaea werneckii]RMY65838.1 hypothetical protein D0863_08839 [Hortaea werneckii]
MLRNVSLLRNARAPSSPQSWWRSYAASSKRGGDATEEELDAARKWLAQLDPDTIPRSICDISFSRSSGPGGQNVNKYAATPSVSSKATVRIPTSSILPLLPPLLRPHILASRYHAAKSSELVIQADDSRKQTENVNSAFRRLHELITDAGRQAVPGETSPEQTKRVAELQKAEAARRRKMKEFQSKKKAARRGGGRDD